MKRMLFNATHQEELRVAIVDGQKLIDLDIEIAGREQRKGNIYKGVITRIEPGLEACFVNYGEDRHGFLPFKEIARSYFKEGVDVRTARIQDALREGQELIVQVEKEERGNKGAALTTFISLAGRYLVLMPNNPRGGGVSRRVEGEERQELREAMDQLTIPPGMSIIARTAGIGRNAEELQWDMSYLMQLWTAIDGAAKDNPAPILIYLESSLVIRAIRDYFSPDIGEILIDTDDIADQASAFMSVVMPDNVERVKRYRDDVPLFSRFQIEHQIETAYSRTVELPSGGSVVIDHTEALVAVDVNSARATRGADIEETALRTNQEAADEVARQLRLRDLGGLIVIDFIDMEDTKNQRAVENRLRDALHFDRARVQMGKISRFGLMELSRQRLRPALNEGSHITCPRCNGTGVIRDAESSALQVLRLLQEEAMKENTAAVHAQVPVDVATFLLNEKRSDITKIESRLKVNLILIPNRHLETPHHHIERLRHDDPRLEDIKTSFDLVDAPSTDMSWAPKEQEIKTKPEALVKGITPSQPAPVSSTPAKKAEVQAPTPGLFSRLFGWLTGGSSTEKKEEAPKAVEETRERSRSGQNDRRGGNRGGRGRRPDNPGESRQASGETVAPAANLRAPKEDERAERAPQLRTESGEQSDDNARGNRNRRGRGRNRREDGIDTRADQSDGIQANGVVASAVSETPAQSERRPQSPRPVIESNQLTEDQANLQQGLDAQGLSEDDIDQADPERKRRRRRSRRGRRTSEDGTSLDSRDDQAQTDDGFDHVSSNALSGAPVNYVEPGSTPTSAASTIASPVPSAVIAVAPVVAAVANADTAAAPVAAAPVAPAPVAPVVAPVAAAPVAATPVEPVPVAPVAAMAQVAVAPAAEISTQVVTVTAATAGVETTTAAATSPVAIPVAASTVAEQVALPVATPASAFTPAPALTPAPAVVSAPAAEPVTQPVTQAQQVPAATLSSAPIVIPAAPADTATLHAIVQTAGLKWVESDPVRVAQAMANQRVVPVKLGREPKPSATVSNEPLVQVETRL
ncbi:Rne/Rng family ribonuclease [Zwartia sp.]|uniref:Rne/Rng family ribonuclease n=1 Tax=Zwartia sp. TaxID=2978004 RepID=UPI00271A9961|nr:Rne/Rng family ribonuclease [Zwartia sp.]MDO9026087.1 Rne/Rng family ribonuclease [Zwartia sp.]